MPSYRCLNNSSEESFHFPVQMTLGGSNYLTYFSSNMHLRTGIGHSRIDAHVLPYVQTTCMF